MIDVLLREAAEASAPDLDEVETESQPPGASFLDRFELLDTLGEGGFGTVILAYDRRLDRKVAIKVPRIHALLSDRLRFRFLEEAKTVARLHHPGIVPLYDACVERSLAYLVMGYCAGPTLAQWLSNRRTLLPPVEAIRIVTQVADAVQYAHSRAILHRDIKPSNILLEHDEASCSDAGLTPRLTDFGLAKSLESEERLTLSQDVLGTPLYMAPEQALGKPREIGVASDIYALGVVLYEMLTGAPPFADLPPVDRLAAVERSTPRSIRAQRVEVSPDMEAVCLKCLEKAPESRYASAAALADDLRRALKGEPVTARPIATLDRVWRWVHRRPLVFGLGMALLVTVVGSSLLMGTLWRLERSQRAETQRHLHLANERGASLRKMIEENGAVLAAQIRDQAHSDGVREALLEQQARLYQQWAALEPRLSDEITYAQSVALHQLANTYAVRGKNSLARQARSSCLQLIENLLANDPENPKYRYDHFYNSMVLACELSGVGPYGERKQLVLRSLREIQALHAESPGSDTYLDAKTTAGRVAGEVLAEADADEARALFLTSAAEASANIGRDPRSWSARKQLARLRERLVVIADTPERREAALAGHREAISLLREAVGWSHAPLELREHLVTTLIQHGLVLGQCGALEESLASLDEAEEHLRVLYRQHPERDYLDHWQVGVFEARARANRNSGNEAAAQAAYLEARRMAAQIKYEPRSWNPRQVMADLDRTFGPAVSQAAELSRSPNAAD